MGVSRFTRSFVRSHSRSDLRLNNDFPSFFPRDVSSSTLVVVVEDHYECVFWYCRDFYRDATKMWNLQKNDIMHQKTHDTN